jgi:hypothetical protein
MRKQIPKICSARNVFSSYADGDLTFERFIYLTQQNCFYCGAKPSNKKNLYKTGGKKVLASKTAAEKAKIADFIYNGLDRVDNNRGHYENNVVPCCKLCNQAKRCLTQIDFFTLVKTIYELHCKKSSLNQALTSAQQ